MPLPDHLETLVQKEMDRIEAEGVLVPITHQASGGEPNGQSEEGKLERLKGDVPVERVQRFWPTAPPEGQPGGSPCTFIGTDIVPLRASCRPPLRLGC